MLVPRYPSFGLVDESTEPAELMPHARALATQVSTRAPASISRMEGSLDRLSLPELEHALAMQTDALVAMYSESAIDEARQAFAGCPRN